MEPDYKDKIYLKLIEEIRVLKGKRDKCDICVIGYDDYGCYEGITMIEEGDEFLAHRQVKFNYCPICGVKLGDKT